jgi:hypothetical protein
VPPSSQDARLDSVVEAINEAGPQKAAALVVDPFGREAIRYAAARAAQLEKKEDRIGQSLGSACCLQSSNC